MESFLRILENDLFKQDWRSRKKREIFQYIVLKWTLALLIGLATGLVGFFNNLAVENIAGVKLLLTNNLMLREKLALVLTEANSLELGFHLRFCVIIMRMPLVQILSGICSLCQL